MGTSTTETGTFGALLRQHRLAASLSQEVLGERVQLSVNAIAALEHGRRIAPRPGTVVLLADALTLSPAERVALISAAGAARLGALAMPDGRSPPPGMLSSLPVPLTSFIGREREVAEIRRLIQTTRLLSLVGAGGVGKTRLAVEAARTVPRARLAGVCVVELAPVGEPTLVARSVARALGVVERADQALLETLAEFIGNRPLLLVLDNCEHLIQACAELAESVLHACPDVRILTTSREPLDLGAELVWRVPSLSLPSGGPTTSVEDVARSEAVRLFVQRASQSRRGFALTPANVVAIAQVCVRLDGIPLAIELAAARVNALSVEQIAMRLDNSLRLLTSGSRTAVDRQRTLRGTLDWSYDLLGESERLLLGRLAVFAGGWTLEAAEAVCSGQGLEPDNVFDLLSNLVDKSLVMTDERGAAAWYRLLDPLRAYALEKLRASADEVRMRSLHRDWYVQLAEQFERVWRSPRQQAWLERVEHEEGNIRVALRWCLDRTEVTEGLRLSGAAARFFWDLGNRAIEGRAWLAELLSASGPSVPMRVRAKALSAAGFLAAYQGDTMPAQALLTEALALWRSLGDGEGIASTLVTLGSAAQFRGDSPRAAALYEEALALARMQGDRVDVYWALNQLATLALRTRDYGRSQSLHEESLVLKRQQGDGYGVGMSLRGLAEVAWMRGDQARAFRLARQSLIQFRELGHWRGIASCLQLLAHLFGDEGDVEHSARLFGAAESLQKALGDRRPWAVVLHVDPARSAASLAAVRARLAPPAFEVAWAAGEAMTTEEAVVFALGITPTSALPGSVAGDAAPQTGLSQRETEVLELVAEGSSNKEIAALLVLSLRTVERHIANLYAKLGARNRAEATAFAVRHGIA